MTEEEHARRIDLDLVEFIDEAIHSSANKVEALDKVLKFKKENRGMTGFHFSCMPTDKSIDAENMASDLLVMIHAAASGLCKDCSDEIL
jgi:hypothetical protein